MADLNSTSVPTPAAEYRRILAQHAHVAAETVISLMRGQVLEDGFRVDAAQADELAARLRALAAEVANARIKGPAAHLHVVRGDLPVREHLLILRGHGIEIVGWNVGLRISAPENRENSAEI